MGILARLRLAKIRTMARPNSPDMLPKRTKKVRLGLADWQAKSQQEAKISISPRRHEKSHASAFAASENDLLSCLQSR